MVRFAEERGFPKIELDVWVFNESAVKFYESLGFQSFRKMMEYKNLRPRTDNTTI